MPTGCLSCWQWPNNICVLLTSNVYVTIAVTLTMKLTGQIWDNSLCYISDPLWLDSGCVSEWNAPWSTWPNHTCDMQTTNCIPVHLFTHHQRTFVMWQANDCFHILQSRYFELPPTSHNGTGLFCFRTPKHPGIMLQGREVLFSDIPCDCHTTRL